MLCEINSTILAKIRNRIKHLIRLNVYWELFNVFGAGEGLKFYPPAKLCETTLLVFVLFLIIEW